MAEGTMLRIGDEVMLRGEAVYGLRRELAGDVGTVGDVWDESGETHCTVVYEDRQCLIWDALASDFEPAPTLH